MSAGEKHDPIQGRIIHVYDGIEEADNELPRWWLMCLYLAVAFSIGYWFYYEEFKAAPGPMQAYLLASAEEAEKRGVDPTDAELLAMLGTPAMKSGEATFVSTCAPCHEQDGRGKIGPNLTDDSWIHGGTPSDVYRVVRDGVQAKGMPAWGPALGRGGVVQVTAFVLSLRNTNVPGGKAAEGTSTPTP